MRSRNRRIFLLFLPHHFSSACLLDSSLIMLVFTQYIISSLILSPTQIAYMDHLDLPPANGQTHQINYNLPRICHVTNADFNLVMKFDRNRMGLEPSFGKLPVWFLLIFYNVALFMFILQSLSSCSICIIFGINKPLIFPVIFHV